MITVDEEVKVILSEKRYRELLAIEDKANLPLTVRYDNLKAQLDAVLGYMKDIINQQTSIFYKNKLIDSMNKGLYKYNLRIAMLGGNSSIGTVYEIKLIEINNANNTESTQAK